MDLLSQRISVCEKIGEILEDIEGVSLEQYRTGVGGMASSTYALFHEYVIRVKLKRGGLFSAFRLKPAVTLDELAKVLQQRIGLPDPDSIVSENQRLHLEGKETPVWVEEINFQPLWQGEFTVKGQDYQRLHEWIKIRTTNSFPTLPASTYRQESHFIPEELLNVWVRLNKHGESYRTYLEMMKG